MRGTSGYPVRLRYTKRGKVRWISHRDVARAMERAFRVSGLPLAFTEGFSPRPKVSFGLALSTGHESDAEYLDLEFTDEVDLDALPAVLSESLPEGMRVVDAVALAERAPALQEAVTAVEWQVEVARADGAPVTAAALNTYVRAALAASTLPTERKRKGREVVEDVRPVIRRVDAHASADDAVFVMELSTQPRSAKPGEILSAVARVVEPHDRLVEVRALRTHQWIERDGTRSEPHDADTRPRAREARAS
jgi:radical SAM-linked protein